MNLNIAHIEPYSFIYGPGCRTAIWLQGCSIHCKGCWNKEMWSFKPKQLLSMPDLLAQIETAKEDIEGITLLGGEPFDQYKSVLALAENTQKLGLSLMLYTGYEREELTQKGYEGILSHTDILISGRYRHELRDLSEQWIGSSNQRIEFLSNRYTEENHQSGTVAEVDIDTLGKATYFGYWEE